MGKAAEVSRSAAKSALWSDWQPIAGLPSLRPDVLAEILDGGQAFRWQQTDPASGSIVCHIIDDKRDPTASAQPIWQGVWADKVCRLRQAIDQQIEWSAPREIAARVGAALPAYLGAERNSATADSLPWRSDRHLERCIAGFPGLQILKQPFGETLLCFLCSATKQIVQIKQMVALLAARHGEEITAGFFRLPTWPELARIPESQLRACLLGFRAGYIAKTARFLAAHPGWLEETETLPYAEARLRLCELPGVGEKVADCVLLFGAGRLEAFPVDVWILKTLARRYGLEGWRPAQLAQFGRAHFGPLAGLAQQYLFAWERREAKRQE